LSSTLLQEIVMNVVDYFVAAGLYFTNKKDSHVPTKGVKKSVKAFWSIGRVGAIGTIVLGLCMAVRLFQRFVRGQRAKGETPCTPQQQTSEGECSVTDKQLKLEAEHETTKKKEAAAFVVGESIDWPLLPPGKKGPDLTTNTTYKRDISHNENKKKEHQRAIETTTGKENAREIDSLSRAWQSIW